VKNTTFKKKIVANDSSTCKAKPLTWPVEEIVSTCPKGMFEGPTKIPNEVMLFRIFLVLANNTIINNRWMDHDIGDTHGIEVFKLN